MKNKKKIIGIIVASVIIILIIGLFLGIVFTYKLELIGEEQITLEVKTKYEEEGCFYQVLGKKKECQIKKNSTFNEEKIGTYEITYQSSFLFLKKEKKRKVTFVDKEAPTITLKGNSEVSIYLNEEYQEEGYEVEDNYDENLTSKVTVTSNLDNTQVGSYEIVYEVEDTSNNKAKVVRTVEVKEKPRVNEARPISTVGTYINGILIVNKTYHLPESYRPGVDGTAYNALLLLQKEASEQGFSLPLISGFRSYETQRNLYNNYVARDGEELANTYSARPGESEHQTGLAFDVGMIDNDFGETEAGMWLNENAHRYGFIIRYLKGKEHITGYQYEPWHIRYVGTKTASEIKAQNITLEEYLGLA